MVPASDTDASSGRAQVSVLHVEDDAAFGELTATYLQRDDGGLPIEVTVETNPEAALDRLDGVDCIVSDHDMPEMDGLEFFEAVRKRRSKVPFVLFTGRGNEEIAARAVGAGVTDYLRKDGGTDQFTVLANRVRNAVARRRAERDAARSEQRLRRALDLLPQCVFVKDTDGQYLLVNETSAERYGCDPSDVEGRYESEFLRDELAARFRAEDEEVVATGETMVIPNQRVVDDDGEERVERVRKIPFDLPGVDEPAVLGVATDITAEQRRERTLDAIATELADALSAVDERTDEAVRNALERAHELASDEREPPTDD